MFRRLFTIAALASLLACLATVVLWVRSYTSELHAWANLPAGRYTVRLSRGRLVLWGPPPPESPPVAKQVEQLAAQLRNNQVDWSDKVIFTESGRLHLVITMSDLHRDPPAANLAFPHPHLPRRGLLKALDDPEKIGAAHVVLSEMANWNVGNPQYPNLLVPLRPAFAKDSVLWLEHGSRGLRPHTLFLDWNGLRVELWPEGASVRYSQYPARLGADDDSQTPNFRLDPASFEQIRDLWHRQLDSPVGSLALWTIALVMLAPPALVGFSFFRQQRAMHRRGACPSCGYNLTGNISGVCPECGTAIPPEPEIGARGRGMNKGVSQ